VPTIDATASRSVGRGTTIGTGSDDVFLPPMFLYELFALRL